MTSWILLVVFFSSFRRSVGWTQNSCFQAPLRTYLSGRSLLLSSSSEDWGTASSDINEPPMEMSSDESDVPSHEELEAMLGNWDERVAKFNTLHLVGRVGNNPDPRHFDDGNVVVNLNLACRRKYHYAERASQNIKNGEEETDWYGLEIWGQLAEVVYKFVDKGARIGVIGSLEIDEWQDRETGEQRSKAKVIVTELEILESKAEADLRRSNQRGSSFYTTDDDDEYNPARGSAGGFFD